MIPLGHDFSGRRVLVFGGGAVGTRRARRFAREAEVVVVGPEFEAAEDLPGVEHVRATPTPADVPDLFDRFDPALAVAATDDAAVNDAVEAAARDAGVLLNRADESGGRDPGSVVVPATVRDDPVTVALTTGGASPALAKHLRERIEGEIAGAGTVATVTADLRAELADRDVSAAARRDALRAAVRDDGVWRAARDGDEAAARERAERAVEDALSAA